MCGWVETHHDGMKWKLTVILTTQTLHVGQTAGLIKHDLLQYFHPMKSDRNEWLKPKNTSIYKTRRLQIIRFFFTEGDWFSCSSAALSCFYLVSPPAWWHHQPVFRQWEDFIRKLWRNRRNHRIHFFKELLFSLCWIWATIIALGETQTSH